MVCDSSPLKSNDYRPKKKSFIHKIFNKCDLGIIEDMNHLEMQCPFYNDERKNLQESLGQINNEISNRILNDSMNYILVIIGKQPDYASFQSMVEVWLIKGECLSRLTTDVPNNMPQLTRIRIYNP